MVTGERHPKKSGPYLERHAYAVAMHIRKRKSRGGIKESVEKVLVASIKQLWCFNFCTFTMNNSQFWGFLKRPLLEINILFLVFPLFSYEQSILLSLMLTSIQSLFRTNTLNSAIFQQNVLSKLSPIAIKLGAMSKFLIFFSFLLHWHLSEEVRQVCSIFWWKLKYKLPLCNQVTLSLLYYLFFGDKNFHTIENYFIFKYRYETAVISPKHCY